MRLSVKVDDDTSKKLNDVMEFVPLITKHAMTLAALRAGVELLSQEPARVLNYLPGYRVRVPSGRGVKS